MFIICILFHAENPLDSIKDNVLPDCMWLCRSFTFFCSMPELRYVILESICVEFVKISKRVSEADDEAWVGSPIMSHFSRTASTDMVVLMSLSTFNP